MIDTVKREFVVDGKKIEIYDDLFPFSEKNNFYSFALNSNYILDRVPSTSPEDLQHGRTLVSRFSIKDILNLEFFKNTFIFNYVKENKLRVQRVYVNLCLACDKYDYHVDDYFEGDKSLLYYLNKEWHPVWEGETHFSSNLKDIDYSSAFIPGRIVLFDSRIPHKSSQPSFDAKFHRFVLVVKFVGTNNPSYTEAWDIIDYIYDKNVKLTNKEKKCIAAVKERTQNIPHSNSNLFEHLLNTFLLLKNMNIPEEVCLSGLFHSSYGTEFYNVGKIFSREEIVSLTNNYTEKMVDVFCSQNRDNLILTNLVLLDKTSKNQKKDSLKDTINLLHLLYANYIEQVYREQLDEKFLYIIKNRIDTLKELID